MMITVENYSVFTENPSAILIICMMLSFEHHYIFTIPSFTCPLVGKENDIFSV